MPESEEVLKKERGREGREGGREKGRETHNSPQRRKYAGRTQEANEFPITTPGTI